VKWVSSSSVGSPNIPFCSGSCDSVINPGRHGGHESVGQPHQGRLHVVSLYKNVSSLVMIPQEGA
jgi:hypothetical protein